MKVIEVIPARQWRNTQTGRTASVNGSTPWANANNEKNWVRETVGWTWKRSNGTIGLGRRPAATKEEAEAVMQKVNNLGT